MIFSSKKKMYVKKILAPKKKLCQKKIWVKKILSQKFFGWKKNWENYF